MTTNHHDLPLDKYTKYGPHGTPNTVKVSAVLGAEDVEFLEQVFPERGVKSNLPGYLLARFVDYLRKDARITTAESRRASLAHHSPLVAIDTWLTSFPPVAEGMTPNKGVLRCDE